MFRPVRFALALPVVLGTVLVASPGRGQPPAGQKGDETSGWAGSYDIKPAPGGEHLEPIKPYYTAFPDLRPPVELKLVKDPDGTARLEDVGEVPLPPLPVLGADAPSLKKAQLEQLKAGLRYRLRIRDVIRRGSWTSQLFLDYLIMSTETYRVAAELEEKPAARVPWFEARVRALKEFERFTYDRVLKGSDPPTSFDQAQFARFQAEAELIRLKAAVEKAGCAPVPPRPLPVGGPPPRMPEPVNPFPKTGAEVPPPKDGPNGNDVPPGPPKPHEIKPPPGAGPELAPLNPPFTAFPDLRPPVELKLVKDPDGTTRLVNVDVGEVPLPALPVLGADAPSLKKARLEQLKAGLRYRLRMTEVIRIGSWQSSFLPFLDMLIMYTETYRVAAELEDKPAARVPWLEARIRALKEREHFTYIRVLNGSDPPQRFDQVQFARFQAEADLIKLKAAVEKAGCVPVPPRPVPVGGPPPRMPEPVNPFPKTGAEVPPPKDGPNGNDVPPGPPKPDEIKPPTGAGPELAYRQPPFTAFPDLRPVETKLVKDPDGTTRQVDVDVGDVPLPPLPVLGVDAPALKKVQLEQLKAGLRYRARIREMIRIGSWTSTFFLDTLLMSSETYRVAAELEDKPAARVPWYEVRVRAFKEFERFTHGRVLNGSDTPQRLDQVQFARFQAEADLIKLKAEVANAGK